MNTIIGQQQLRRRDEFKDRENKKLKVTVYIPIWVWAETRNTLEVNNPEPFYNLSHYVTCSLIKQNQAFKGVVTMNNKKGVTK